MKKLFVSILALAAFAACQSGFDGVDVDINAPIVNGENIGGTHTIYAEVGVGGETKATYNDALKATWEEGDQIALLQEHADYGKTFSVENKLDIKEGWGTNSAAFHGDISVDATAPRVYHIAYPASAVWFNVISALTKTSNSEYSTKTADSTFDGSMAYYSASADYKYSYNSTLNITVPATQNGKWEPYMYASTSEAVSSEGIGAKKLTTLTGAIAIRAFEADGVTPKQLASVTITSSDAAIAGVFAGSAESVATVRHTGAYTPDSYSTISDNDVNTGLVNWPGRTKGKAAADELLASKAQSYEPTSTSVTKAMSLSFAGSEKVITLTNLEDVAMDSEDFYTYYANVAPATVGSLTIVAYATDGTRLVKNFSNQTFRAEARRGFLLKWESAEFSSGSIETWYDNYSTDSSFNLEGNTIYVNNLKVKGVEADHVLALGVMVNGTLYGAQSGVLEVAQVKAEGLPNGVYTAKAYAKVLVNGEEVELIDAVRDCTVTSIPAVSATFRSSYSDNGNANPTNSINGRDVQISASLSDSSFPSNLVSSCKLKYNSASENIALGSTKKTWALGSYNCSVVVTLANGYVCSTPTYATHVTGIPFTMTTSSNADDWTTSGNVNWNTDGGMRLGYNQWGGEASITKSFNIPANINVKVTANGTVCGTGSKVSFIDARVENTATVIVGSTTVVNTTKNGDGDASWSCSNASASMSSSSNAVKVNSSYNLQNAKVVVKALTIQY